MSASRRFNSEDRGRKIVLRNEETGATVGFTCFELCELTMAVNAAREMIELAVNQELADRFQQLVGGSVEDWWRSEPPIQKENVSMEQIVIRLARPEVGVEYRPESPEAEPADQLAALELALHALAQRVQQLRVTLGMPCPPEVERLVASDLWRRGL